jgi:hypothetical protein
MTYYGFSRFATCELFYYHGVDCYFENMVEHVLCYVVPGENFIMTGYVLAICASCVFFNRFQFVSFIVHCSTSGQNLYELLGLEKNMYRN